MEELVQKIIEVEWNQFQLVKNEGGRAACQDDWNTFQLMRESQFINWPLEILESYAKDLMAAMDNNWNLIFEKYTRMMKSTVPEKYKTLEHILPALSQERIERMEKTIAIQVKWMEEFADKYPNLMSEARYIHTYEDSEYETSSETYLRGELASYSEETEKMYGAFVEKLLKEGKNLTQMTYEHMVKRYGYKSIEDAEEKMKK
jgi:hypothetical protein